MPWGWVATLGLLHWLSSDEAAAVVVVDAMVPGENTASPARVVGGGRVPSGMVAGPISEKYTQWDICCDQAWEITCREAHR